MNKMIKKYDKKEEKDEVQNKKQKMKPYKGFEKGQNKITSEK